MWIHLFSAKREDNLLNDTNLHLLELLLFHSGRRFILVILHHSNFGVFGLEGDCVGVLLLGDVVAVVDVPLADVVAEDVGHRVDRAPNHLRKEMKHFQVLFL